MLALDLFSYVCSLLEYEPSWVSGESRFRHGRRKCFRRRVITSFVADVLVVLLELKNATPRLLLEWEISTPILAFLRLLIFK